MCSSIQRTCQNSFHCLKTHIPHAITLLASSILLALGLIFLLVSTSWTLPWYLSLTAIVVGGISLMATSICLNKKKLQEKAERVDAEILEDIDIYEQNLTQNDIDQAYERIRVTPDDEEIDVKDIPILKKVLVKSVASDHDGVTDRGVVQKRAILQLATSMDQKVEAGETVSFKIDGVSHETIQEVIKNSHNENTILGLFKANALDIEKVYACPISYSLIETAIRVECCNQLIDQTSLRVCLEAHPACPFCRMNPAGLQNPDQLAQKVINAWKKLSPTH